MGCYGTLNNKKDVEYLLQTGCNYLQSIIKDYVGESEDKTFDDLERLKKVLYNEGQGRDKQSSGKYDFGSRTIFFLYILGNCYFMYINNIINN